MAKQGMVVSEIVVSLLVCPGLWPLFPVMDKAWGVLAQDSQTHRHGPVSLGLRAMPDPGTLPYHSVVSPGEKTFRFQECAWAREIA